MENEFHGFKEDDKLKSAVQDKLTWINQAVTRLEDEGQDESTGRSSMPSANSQPTPTTVVLRRPSNRFLKTQKAAPVPLAPVPSISVEPEPAPTGPYKRRFLSGDYSKRKRKLSNGVESTEAKNGANANNSVGILEAPAPSNAETAARPRRTIIRNRKFFDIEEPQKDVPRRKSEGSEPQRKRWKSERMAQNGNYIKEAEINGTNANKAENVFEAPAVASVESAARPRRTIIRNRKFFDAEEPQKDVSRRKSVNSESQKKRRKSEKIAQNGDVYDVKEVEIKPLNSKDGNEIVEAKTENVGAITLSSQNDASDVDAKVLPGSILPKKVLPISNLPSKVLPGSNLPTIVQPVNNLSTEVLPVNNLPTKVLPVDNLPTKVLPFNDMPKKELPAADSSCAKIDANVTVNESTDELLLEEPEANLYAGKPVFLGTCIVKMTEQFKTCDEESSFKGGIICCGVCFRIKKYRTVNEKRKRGSFLCTDCIGIVSRIFQVALKAKPFSCILGPPVCEGSCPLVFSPQEQFCEACFAKTCLRNLPMKDDIYFKIWRSIPPMSRGCVPTAPVKNQDTPHIGKVVSVNEQGCILSTTGSLKMLGTKKTQNSNGVDLISEDSNSNDTFKNGEEDLNSARITTFSHRTDSSSNCENTVPLKTSNESLLAENSKDIKANGVSKEEILLGRQIGQERVKAVVDPILKSDLNDVEIFGFPVVVSGSAFPRKPLCFLCGSAGIEQLIFCSMCCEPFHPYCAGDDLLLDTYIAHCDTKDNYQDLSDNPNEDCKELESQIIHQKKSERSVSTTGTSRLRGSRSNSENDGSSRIVLKWTCRRCISCKTCNESIGQKELIRCNRCHDPFHVQTCVDKKVFSKIKDVDQLKKVWMCEICLKCKSCGRKIESNKRLHSMQPSENEDDVENNSEATEQRNYIMLCQDCFKQRKKGSYCPLCEVCYDDNDWDSKMMECCKCNRWIHATCENLTDEQYYILGTLPEYIEYNCRLCDPSESPLWYDALQSQLIKECSSAIRLFEKKALGALRRKRASLDAKPSFVCNLFGGPEFNDTKLCTPSKIAEDQTHDTNLSTPLKIAEDETHDSNLYAPLKIAEHQPHKSKLEDDKTIDITPRLRKGIRKTVSCKEMLSCEVHVRDFVKYPVTQQENWYALKILGVEFLNKVKMQDVLKSTRTPGTPIHLCTPVKTYTPTKHVISIISSIRDAIGSIKSLHLFQRLMIQAVENAAESEAEINLLTNHVKDTMKEAFPWFNEDFKEPLVAEVVSKPSSPGSSCGSERSGSQFLFSTDAFKEVYWDNMDFFDDRVCALCGEVGDFPPELCGRLLWAGVNEWIHCNCAIWSSEVWELENGALQQIGAALIRGKMMRCAVCGEKGATVSCCNSGCKRSYHLLCAMEAECYLLEDKTMFCPHHQLKPEQEDDIQHDMKVGRKVFVDLDWIQKRGLKAFSDDIKIFVGSLKINCLGSLVPISVALKSWEKSSDTFLIPVNFEAQRIFWCLEDPWRKDCYTLKTEIGSNGFTNKVHDVGVNLVVDHTKNEETVKKSKENIKHFHHWLSLAPRYIDEDFVDWLPQCTEEFSTDEEVGFDVFGGIRMKGRTSPSSVSSLESIRKLSRRSRLTNQKNFDGFDLDGVETMSTEGYSSSLDGSIHCTPKSAFQSKQKRRRSLTKTRKTVRKRGSQNSLEKMSPRRRSMRNLHIKETASGTCWDLETQCKLNEDSDNDSGVIDENSATGSCDDERMRCRVNLLEQFNETLEECIPSNSKLEIKKESEMEPFISDNMSEISSATTVQITSRDEESSRCSPFTEIEQSGKIYLAMIKFELKNKDKVSFQSYDAKSTWMSLFDRVSRIRKEHNLTPLVHPTLSMKVTDGQMDLANSFRMLGITHRSLQYVVEQLPEILSVVDRHSFQYSHRPYVDPDDVNTPQPLNSTGCARSQGFTGRKPFDMFGWLANRHRKVPMSGISEETSRSHGLPLAMRFRDLREKSRRFVVLHSKIHGRGLYARCDVEKGDMIIEYAGEVIRPSLCDPREKYYESKGIGCYMFRIKTQVIDATLKGNAARFINHSCEPNCEAKTVRILGKDHIIIFAIRKIFRGEELTYDYKFEREENKIPCTCGASRCRKYMN